MRLIPWECRLIKFTSKAGSKVNFLRQVPTGDWIYFSCHRIENFCYQKELIKIFPSQWNKKMQSFSWSPLLWKSSNSWFHTQPILWSSIWHSKFSRALQLYAFVLSPTLYVLHCTIYRLTNYSLHFTIYHLLSKQFLQLPALHALHCTI